MMLKITSKAILVL